MKLVFFVGQAGTGKTRISMEMAKRTNAVYLDKDVIGKNYMDKLCALMGMDSDDRDSPVYHQHFRDMEYQAVVDIAAQNLRLGNDVYVIAPFNKEINDESWLNQYLIEHHISKDEIEVKVVIVYVENIEEHKQRIIKRNSERDRWKIDNWDEYQEKLRKEIQVKWDIPEKNITRLNNDKELSEQRINELLGFLK